MEWVSATLMGGRSEVVEYNRAGLRLQAYGCTPAAYRRRQRAVDGGGGSC